MNKSLHINRPVKSLRELAQDAIRQAILDLTFVPGERLFERALCEQLGVSRTVVREVLRYLEAEGLIEVARNKGPIVARIRPSEVEQIYELRALLESTAAGACAKLASSADLAELELAVTEIERASAFQDPMMSLLAASVFYEKMFKAAGKTIAFEIVKAFNVRINGLRALTISKTGRLASSANEMRLLYEVIASGNSIEAQHVAARHVESAAEVARSIFRTEAVTEDELIERLQSIRTGAIV